MALSDYASLLMGGLQGGAAGAGIAGGLKAAGYASAGPWAPWLMGGGLALGAVGTLLGNMADTEEKENDPEYQAAKRRERGLAMFRNNIGRALHATQPKTFGGMLGAP